ncbi:MAG TPA: sugar phosphate nucleotidyltransferase [Methyloceanibacter sp.]|nr:sugar phosphate nucleotidyltransferase [Methyloceanibacter sp.]
MPFILCGGAGTRLWPLSREAYPKQFHRLTGKETLFEETCRRFSGPLFGDPFILANHRYRFLIAEQMEAIGLAAKGIVLELVSRNTGPSAAIAALIAAQEGAEVLVLLAPSDHMIGDAGAFARAIETGVPAAEAGALVVFGIEPDCPHTGYGYIEAEPGDGPGLKVRRFVEKPSLEAAERVLDQGGS